MPHAFIHTGNASAFCRACGNLTDHPFHKYEQASTDPPRRKPSPFLIQGYRASECGVPKSRNPYPSILDNKPNPCHERWKLGWDIKFFGEKLPGV